MHSVNQQMPEEMHRRKNYTAIIIQNKTAYLIVTHGTKTKYVDTAKSDAMSVVKLE